jgi:hypothetical protein
MADNQEKIVHFVDYENVHKHIPIDEIARGNHQRVLLFVGNQQTIPNDWLIVDYNITVIRVGKTSKDNVDFHISAYLGMVHVGRDNSVRFIVWSKDKGFDDLIEHLKSRKRRIERKEPSKPKKIAGTPSKKVIKPVVEKKKIVEEKPETPQEKIVPPSIKQVGSRVVEILEKTAPAKRPRKQTTLQNQLEHWRPGIKFKHTTLQVINWLTQKQHIVITDDKVKYNF